MAQVAVLRHEFVEFIPDDPEEGTLYISMEFGTVTHKCCCGCGREVVTPLSPTDWSLIFDGKTISLDPSIGNWAFECKSHYWIRRSHVKWAPRWSQEQINRERNRDRTSKEKYFGAIEAPTDSSIKDSVERSVVARKAEWRFWRTLRKWWS